MLTIRLQGGLAPAVTRALPRLALPRLALPRLALPRLALPRLALPRLALPRLALPRLALPRLALPRLALPRLALPRLALPRLALPRLALPLVALACLAACGLPRSGPSRGEIFAGSVMRQGDAFVLVVDDRVNAIAGVQPALGFSSAFEEAGLLGSDTIQPGDTLEVTVFENVDDGLIVPEGANATQLSEVQVDGQGFIFIPYAGRIRAAGNSPEAVRGAITRALEEQTPDPQVQVFRVAGEEFTVSVSGEVEAAGVFPIGPGTQTLTAALAQAGGPTVDTDVAEVTLVRGGTRGSIRFEDLYDNPGADIALRPGDRIVVETDDRSFTALGATGEQTLVAFDDGAISAVEAIASVGGLSSTEADPTGVFVFRNEPEAIARQLVGRPDLVGTQRVVYVLDLTRPNGIFFARDFAVRDGDTVYVTEAPFVQFSKVIGAITGSLGDVGTGADTVAAL